MNFLIFLEPCEDPSFLGVLRFISSIIDVLFIIIPIGLIVMLSIDLVKCLISDDNEQKKNMSLIVKRIVYSVMVFMVPTIGNFFINVVTEYITDINSTYNSCIINMKNIDYFQQRADELKEAEKKEREARIAEAKEKALAQAASNSNKSSGKSEGSYIGQKYKMNDALLSSIANKCAHEQSSIAGVKAEASLMANRFELFGSKFGNDANGLKSYVYESGWWAGGTTNATKEQKAAVKQVLVNGNRTLPLYVDEHDCIDCGRYGFDVVKIVTNGKTITNHSELKNHNNYIKNKTVIYNKHDAEYTFYTFPSKNSDPFGYTEEARMKYQRLNKG